MNICTVFYCKYTTRRFPNNYLLLYAKLLNMLKMHFFMKLLKNVLWRENVYFDLL